MRMWVSSIGRKTGPPSMLGGKKEKAEDSNALQKGSALVRRPIAFLLVLKKLN